MALLMVERQKREYKLDERFPSHCPFCYGDIVPSDPQMNHPDAICMTCNAMIGLQAGYTNATYNRTFQKWLRSNPSKRREE